MVRVREWCCPAINCTGTTLGGGSAGAGAVFALNTDGTGFTNLHAFTAPSGADSTNSDGDAPNGELLLSGGTLYGTACFAGSAGNGTLFAIGIDGTGFTNLHTFTATSGPNAPNSDGANPTRTLILSGSTLYGTTIYGGSGGSGTVFAVNTNGTGFTTLYSFTPTSGPNSTNSDGANLPSELVLSGTTLYGTAANGGTEGHGTVFSLSFPPPRLTAAASGAGVILTWPANYAGFDYSGYVLQSTAQLGPSAVWTTNSTAPVIVNGLSTVTNPISGPARFFRLSQ